MAAYLVLWLFSLALGFCLVYAIWPQQPSGRGITLRLALGVGPGIGTASALFFLCRSAGLDSPAWVYLLILALLMAVLGMIAAWRVKRLVNLKAQIPAQPKRWIWVVLLVSATILVANGLLARAAINPEGEWDAWAMWNLHARFLFQPGEAWLGMFDPALVALTHPDYPLLTPGMIALSWRTLGRVSSLPPASVALAFTLATIGLLWAALSYQGKHTAAYLAALVGLLSGSLLSVGAILYADIPLAFAILGAVVCTYFYFKEEQTAWLVLSGLFCGLATWTKNEGWSLFLATVAAFILTRLFQRQPWRAIAGRLGMFLAGALPWLLVTVYYKLAFAPLNDLFAARTISEVLDKLLSLARWNEIGGRVIQSISQYDGRIFVLLALMALAVGVSKERNLPVAAGWLVVGLIALQYMVIYAITPYQLDWHLDTALARLITHNYPATLFLIFTRLELGR